jgi:hypothetical protein
MKRLRFLSPLAALFFLGACASAPEARSDARTWILGGEDGEARLAYGTPDSDDAPLMMRCQTGSGRVTLSRDAARPGEGLALASGDRKVVLHGAEEPDMLNGQGVIVTAQTGLENPVLRRFRDTGRLAMISDTRRAELPATAEERARIRQFFQGCGAA